MTTPRDARAEAQAEAELVAQVNAGGPGWKAAAAQLAIRWPERWALPENSEDDDDW